MDKLEQLTQQVANLTSKFSTLSTEHAALKVEHAEAQGKLAAMDAEKKEREAAAHKAAMSAKRTEVTKVFDEAITDGRVTPAQKASFTKVLRIEDDAALAALDMDDVKALCQGNKATFSKEQGNGSGNGTNNDPEAGKTASEIVASRANKLMTEGKASTFSVATQMVFEADKDLARRYINANDEEK